MSQRLDLLLHLGDGALVLAATGVEGTLAATDTLDVSGLYIHSMNYFDRTVNITPGARAFAMYVVRVGQSPGTRAEWLIGLRGVTELTAADNHPAGPADERVGCYVLEPGEWTDGGTRWRRSRGSVWFPRHLRLHWQYQWAYGVDPYLVATAAGGHVSEKVRLFRWEPVAPDSLRVVFGARFIGTTFRGAAEGEDYVGELSIRADADLAPPPSAPARLVREPCRESDVR